MLNVIEQSASFSAADHPKAMLTIKRPGYKEAIWDGDCSRNGDQKRRNKLSGAISMLVK